MCADVPVVSPLAERTRAIDECDDTLLDRAEPPDGTGAVDLAYPGCSSGLSGGVSTPTGAE